MKQLRNRAMRFKAAKEAEQGIGLIRSFNGQKTLGKVAALILKIQFLGLFYWFFSCFY